MSRNPQRMNPIKLFKTGQQYMFICPKDKSLALSFPEIKIISYIKLATKYIPPAVVALFVWQYYMNAGIIITLITSFFAISLPIQGIFWLGKRANTPLPLNLLSWYNQTKQKLVERQLILSKSEKNEPLNFMAFMVLLKLARTHLSDELDEDHP